jgi:superfamily II DNA/RNA helicase
MRKLFQNYVKIIQRNIIPHQLNHELVLNYSKKSQRVLVPHQVKNETVQLDNDVFEKLPQVLQDYLSNKSIKRPSEIQSLVIPPILRGKNVLLGSQTVIL